MEYKQYDIIECIDGEPTYEEACLEIARTKREFAGEVAKNHFKVDSKILNTYAKQKLDKVLADNNMSMSLELYRKVQGRLVQFIKEEFKDVPQEYREYLEEEREHRDKGE